MQDPSIHTPVRVAAIGVGGWGRNIFRTLMELPQCELHAVVDNAPSAFSSLRARRSDLTFTCRLSEVLENEHIEAVTIAVPPAVHHEIASQCLAAGKHVFVEKPLTTTAQAADDLVQLASAHSKVLMVGHLMLYHPAVVALHQLIRQGELGTIRYIHAQRLNLGVVRRSENAWWSLAPHDISIARYLLDSAPESVSATGGCFLQPESGIEDVVFASVRFASGAFANIHSSWLDPNKVRKMTIVGSRKMVVFDDMQPSEKLRIFDVDTSSAGGFVSHAEATRIRAGEIHIPTLSGAEPLREELAAYCRAVRTGQAPRAHAASGAEVVRVLEAGQRSIAGAGERIMVAQPTAETSR